MNKKITLFAVLMLLGTYTVLPAFSEDEAISDTAMSTEEQNVKANKSTLDKAQEAIDNKDFQTAVMLMNSYISSKPKRYEGYKLRGDAYYALRQYAASERDYQKAIDLKTDDDKLMTGTKYISAVVLGADKNEQLQNVELGNLYARLMYAQKAQNDPAYATAYANAQKYNSHIYLPQPKKSDIGLINCPQKYGKPLNPQGVDADIYGAVSDIEKEDYNSALFKLQKAVAQYPNYYFIHYLYGVTLAGLEKDTEAAAEFEKAISLNPSDFESYASLGQLYYSKAETTFSPEDAQKSTQYFKQALRLNENCYVYYFYIGLNELQQGNADSAISYFNKAIKLNSSDYNSMYYKAIAQFNKGDYNSVIEGTTNLLYRHVSNYNSVLYLRALAQTRLGQTGKALSDLESIQNNIEDIYNADIKVVTDRDRALESYIYYLKSEISHLHGQGSAADTDKAMQNPIIAQLSRAQNAMRPYENALKSENITLEDYKKFEDFYNSGLTKMLGSGIVLTAQEVENQYDYIRTTFDDLGLSFVYSNPDYKLTTIKDYPYKKYSSKLNSDELASLPAVVDAEDFQKPEITMQKTTPQIQMLENEAQPSLARMLASNGLAARTNSTALQKNNVETFKPEVPEAEKVESASNIASGEPFVYTDKPSPLVDTQNTKDVKEILDAEKNMPEIEEVKNENGSIKISAKDVQETPDIIIKYPTQATEVKKVEKQIETKTEEKIAEVQKQITNTVNEKHADINPEDFGVKTPTNNIIPIIESSDDVVELSSRDVMRTIKPQFQSQVEEKVEPVTEAVTLAQDKVEEIKEEVKAIPTVVVPENEAPKNNETLALRPREVIETAPVAQNVADEVDTVAADVSSAVENLQSEAEKIVSSKIAEAEQAPVTALTRAEQKALAKEQKAKDKAEKKAAKLEAKAQRAQEKAELKAQRSQAKAQAKALKDELAQKAAQEKAELKAQQVQAKQELKAQKLKEQEELAAQKAEAKAQALAKKAEEKAQNEQLKLERAQAVAEVKAKEAEHKAEQKAQKLAQKQAKAEERALKKAQAILDKETETEKQVSNIKKEKFSFKKFFAKFRRTKTDVSSEKKVIKSLSARAEE